MFEIFAFDVDVDVFGTMTGAPMKHLTKYGWI